MNGLNDVAAIIMLIALAGMFLYIIYTGILMISKAAKESKRWRIFRESVGIGKVYSFRKLPEHPWDREEIICYMIDDIRGDYIRYHNIEDTSENPYYRACKIRTFWDRYKDIIVGF